MTRLLFSLALATCALNGFAQLHMVTSLADSGPGTLRNEIGAANEGDTVQISPTLLSAGNATIQLQSEILITTPIVLIGAIQSGDTVFISGGNSNRAFNIDFPVWNKTMTLIDLAIIDCSSSTWGGAIFTDNVYQLVINDCLFRDNKTTSSFGSGGAIRMDGGKIICDGAVFINNQTGGSCGSSSGQTGGAIEVSFGQYDIDHSSFIGNKTCARGGAMAAPGSNGAIKNSTFHDNSTTGGSLGGGGALFLNGGAATIENCNFTDNSTAFGGGAAYITSSYTTVSFKNSSFENNQATAGGGGAINAFSVDQLNLTGCTFHSNTTTGSFPGGAIYHSNGGTSIKTSTLFDNTMPMLYVTSANSWSFDITNSTFANSNSSTAAMAYIPSSRTGAIRSSIFVSAGTGASITGGATVTSSTYNIYRDNPTFSSSSDQKNISYSSLGFQPLQLNGGHTKTLLPSAVSPASEAGDPADFTAAQNSAIYGIREVGAAERAIIIRDTASTCDSYSFWGNTYSSTGTYIVNVSGGSSLDSTGILYLTVTEIDTVIVDSSAYLVSMEMDSSASYQWVYCDSGYTAISGETNGVFKPSVNGSYALIISKGQCTDTSACYNYDQVSLSEVISIDFDVRLYPNPARNNISIQSDRALTPVARIYNLEGKFVGEVKIESNQMNLGHLPPGTYLVSLIDRDGIKLWKKIVLQ